MAVGHDVTLPDELAMRVQQLVSEGEYPTLEAAVADLVRQGLDAKRGGGSPRKPWSPRELPPSERPIEPDPTDLKWMD